MPRDQADDGTRTGSDLVNARLALLEGSPVIRKFYVDSDYPLDLYGLPTSTVQQLGNARAIRTQRAVLLEWLVDVPWAKAGAVTVANGGQIAKDLGVFPLSATVPAPPPLLPAEATETPDADATAPLR